MLGQSALRTACGQPASFYPAGINFLRSPIVYTAFKGVSDPAAVGPGEIATDSTDENSPDVMVDGDTSSGHIWNTRYQDLVIWVRTPVTTQLSETRIAYYQTDVRLGVTGTLDAWIGGAWTPVATLTYGGGGALVSDTFPPVQASLFRLTFTPGDGGWVGITEIELYP